MKQIFTLTILMIVSTATFCQVVINEIYPDPGSGRHEFFELYNTSTSSASSSVDAYTIMSYFESGSTRGFYVLDLPDLLIPPKGFFVGSAAMPFSYQITNNSTDVNYSWNDPLLAAKFGYLKKWVLANDNNNLDGNLNYNLSPVSLSENNVFVNLSGSGAAYNFFIFKNGVLINSFFGNFSGTNFPAMIATMPSLNVDVITSSLPLFTFNLNFNVMQQTAFESVTASIGSDNGYIRTKDGTCGSWTKSSAGVNHTPARSNGKPGNSASEVQMAASIIRGTEIETTSSLTFSLISASTNVFPLEIQLYIDNGSVVTELDAADNHLETIKINSFSTIQYVSKFSPKDAEIIMVIKTAAGCFDQVKHIPNIEPIILPVTIASFNGKKENGKILLNWTVAENELLDKVILEKLDDQQVKERAMIIGTDRPGIESYNYSESAFNNESLYYRLKVFHKSGKITYSKTINLQGNEESIVAALITNPVKDYFRIRLLNNNMSAQLQIRVMDQNGKLLMAKYFQTVKGENILELPESGVLHKGFYYIEIGNAGSKIIIKAVKN